MRSCPRARAGTVMGCRDRVSVSQLMQNAKSLTEQCGHQTFQISAFWADYGNPEDMPRNKLSTRLTRSRLGGVWSVLDLSGCRCFFLSPSISENDSVLCRQKQPALPAWENWFGIPRFRAGTSVPTRLAGGGGAASYVPKKQPSKSASFLASLTVAELDQSKTTVLNTLASAHSRRSYKHAIEEFIGWYCSGPRLGFNRSVVANGLQVEIQN